MRFCAEVDWSPEGTLEGEIAADDSPGATFHGVIQLVGLIEAQLGRPPSDRDPAGVEDRDLTRKP